MPVSDDHSLRPAGSRKTRLGMLTASTKGLVSQSDADDVVVSGVTLNSREVRPRDLYAALPGAHTHGARYAADAVSRGASAILTDPEGAALVGDTNVPVLVLDDVRGALGHVSSLVYGTNEHTPEIFGTTGTNGKTSTSYLIRSILQSLQRHVGLVGTIEILAGDEVIPSTKTTPESPDLHAILARMNELKVDSAAIEVTSHALEFHRVDGVRCVVAGLTNLTHDHLDLHGDMETYFRAKAKLFTPEFAMRAVINVDDEWGVRFVEEASIPVRRLLTREATASDAPEQTADYVVENVERRGLGHAFTLRTPNGERLELATELPFDFNVSNVALAVAMVLESGISVATLRASFAEAPLTLSPFIAGRMQVVHSQPTAIVDFAHNPDALRRVLASAATDEGRVILVFGATGDRDREKRPIMGEIAALGADVVIVTDDDPHREDPARIRQEVFQGAINAAPEGVQVMEIAPRADAIAEAVLRAGENDIIIVAGRGHETAQDVNGEVVEIDDRVELERAFAAREDNER